MLTKSEADRISAESKFKRREAQKADAPIASQEYRDKIEATSNRTRKLREERLAREAAGTKQKP